MRDPRAVEAAGLLQDSRRAETPEELMAADIKGVLDAPVSTDLDGVETMRVRTCVNELWIDLLQRDPKALESHITLRLIGKAIRMAGWGPGPRCDTPRTASRKRTSEPGPDPHPPRTTSSPGHCAGVFVSALPAGWPRSKGYSHYRLQTIIR